MIASATLGSARPSEDVLDYIERRWSGLRHAPVKLAEAGRVTPRTARNWLDKQCAPQLDHVIELMAADPEMEAVIFEILRVRRAEGSVR